MKPEDKSKLSYTEQIKIAEQKFGVPFANIRDLSEEEQKLASNLENHFPALSGCEVEPIGPNSELLSDAYAFLNLYNKLEGTVPIVVEYETALVPFFTVAFVALEVILDPYKEISSESLQLIYSLCKDIHSSQAVTYMLEKRDVSMILDYIDKDTSSDFDFKFLIHMLANSIVHHYFPDMDDPSDIENWFKYYGLHPTIEKIYNYMVNDPSIRANFFTNSFFCDPSYLWYPEFYYIDISFPKNPTLFDETEMSVEIKSDTKLDTLFDETEMSVEIKSDTKLDILSIMKNELIGTNSLSNSYFNIYFFKNKKNIYEFFTYCKFMFFEENLVSFFDYWYYYLLTLNIFFIPIYLGFFFKLAVAPFHFWSPEVYEDSPNSSAFFFSVITKISIIIIATRFFNINLLNTSVVSSLVVSCALLSVLVGSNVNLNLRKFKSLLVYSSISHVGFLFIPFGVKTLEGLQMLFFYIFIYTLSGMIVWSIFMIIKNVSQKYKKQNKELTFFNSLFKSNPSTTITVAFIFFSFAGLPPLVGFLSKLNVLIFSLKNNMFYLTSLLSFLSVVAAFYYIRIIKVTTFELTWIDKLYESLPIKKVNIISILTFLFFFLFFSPSEVYSNFYKFLVILFTS